MYDVAIIGGGMAGVATAARLQAQGYSTIIFEAHGRPGGCAGYFRRQGFSFDVGATTLVDFEPDGVGGELLNAIGLTLDAETLPGYVAWLPDRTVTLYRDRVRWAAERLSALGNSPDHRRFWHFLDHLADTFWAASRKGVSLPLRGPGNLVHNLNALGIRHLPLARYLRWTMGDALRAYNLRSDHALCGLLSMLIEDTVHSSIDEAPLINAALGITIRGAGLARHNGGMMGFWQRLIAHYRQLGGKLWTGCRVERVEGHQGNYSLHTQRGLFHATQVVSAVPTPLTAHIAPTLMEKPLKPYLKRDEKSYGGAIVVFLGVPEHEVSHQTLTHHQLLQQYDQPLGNGNNMFISISSPGDLASAPPGYRTVMISTHCDLEPWAALSQLEYETKKRAIGNQLIQFARRVYPTLGQGPLVYEIGTPRTYANFTGRLRGAVSGVRQTLANSNQNAIPHDVGPAGFWMVGDSTWPGLGTVACVLGSRIVAGRVIDSQKRQRTLTHPERSIGYANAD